MLKNSMLLLETVAWSFMQFYLINSLGKEGDMQRE